MAILKREKKEEVKDFVLEDTGLYFTMNKWLSKILRVVDIQSGVEWNIDSDCKMIYSYLRNFGKVNGYNNIYPNQDLISRELGINVRTVRRKLKTLGECGLIDIIKMRVEGENFYSNRYRVNYPSYVNNRRWFDSEGNVLSGDRYKFNYSQFKKKE